jgi:hypothetical protein
MCCAVEDKLMQQITITASIFFMIKIDSIIYTSGEFIIIEALMQIKFVSRIFAVKFKDFVR